MKNNSDIKMTLLLALFYFCNRRWERSLIKLLRGSLSMHIYLPFGIYRYVRPRLQAGEINWRTKSTIKITELKHKYCSSTSATLLGWRHARNFDMGLTATMPAETKLTLMVSFLKGNCQFLCIWLWFEALINNKGQQTCFLPVNATSQEFIIATNDRFYMHAAPDFWTF